MISKPNGVAPGEGAPIPRAWKALVAGLRSGTTTTLFLLKIIVPVSLAVALLDWSGLLAVLAGLLRPIMGLAGLPGEAALVFISSVFLNIYSAIAVAASLSLSLREATILALMCLIAHNLIIETAVMRKTGSSALKMVFLRLSVAGLGALALNWLLPAGLGAVSFSSSASASRLDILPTLAAWASSTMRMALKIIVIVYSIMMGQKLLAEFRVMDLLSKALAPLMRVFGLPASSSFLWLVVNVVGYAYGAGIVVKEIEEGRMKAQEADLFNHHAGISHSLLEDTALFLAVGIPFFWITVPRLVLALLVVWLERFRRHYFRRSFRAGLA